MSATATEPEIQEPKAEVQPVTQIIAMDRAAELVHLHSKISLEQMQSEYKTGNAFAMPCVNESKTYPIELPRGETIHKPLSIDIENKGVFSYAFLSQEKLAQPQFRGWVIVTKDSPAARNQSGERLPDRYFGGRNYIMVGSCYLSFCLSGYSNGWKKSGQDLALEHLRSFMPETASAEIKEDGQRMGGVITQDHNVYTGDEYLDNKMPEKGNKRK